MSRYAKTSPKLAHSVQLLEVIGTPKGNATVTALGVNGAWVSFVPSSGRIMATTGKGLNCSGGARLAAKSENLGYFRYDQFAEPAKTFRRPAGIVAGE